jgi:hypothetical protein
MFPLRSVLLGLVLPMGVMAASLVLGLRWSRWRGATIGLGLGYIIGHVALAWPAFPPIDVTDRLPWLALAAMVVGLLESLWPISNRLRWATRLSLLALTLLAILGPIARETVRTGAGVAWLAVVGVSAFVSWVLLERLFNRLSKGGIEWLLVLIAGSSAALLLVSGSLVLGQLGLVLAAVLGALALISWRAARPMLDRGALLVVLSVLTALVLDGHVYAFVPVSSALLLAASPLAAWVDKIGPARRLGPRGAAIVRGLAVMVPLAVAIGLALNASPSYE